jgi:hypothetical protein
LYLFGQQPDASPKGDALAISTGWAWGPILVDWRSNNHFLLPKTQKSSLSSLDHSFDDNKNDDLIMKPKTRIWMFLLLILPFLVAFRMGTLPVVRQLTLDAYEHWNLSTNGVALLHDSAARVRVQKSDDGIGTVIFEDGLRCADPGMQPLGTVPASAFRLTLPGNDEVLIAGAGSMGWRVDLEDCALAICFDGNSQVHIASMGSCHNIQLQ